MDLGPAEIRWIIQAIIILILSICVHEFGHAIVADKLGDPLPRSQGRVTLNPVSHADPIGTLVMPLAAMVLSKGAFAGFGWGRPVEVSPHKMTRKLSMRRAHMLVSAAGPAMNLVLFVIISVTHAILIKTGVVAIDYSDGALPTTLHEVLLWAGRLNLILMFFNLLPAPPLDGGTVIAGLLPRRQAEAFEKLAAYGPFVIIAIVITPGASKIFTVPATWMQLNFGRLIGLFG